MAGEPGQAGLAAASRRLRPGPAGSQAQGQTQGRVLPRLFLFSDRLRLPDPRAAAARLPPGAAVVARGLAPAVLAGLAALARRRRLVLLVAGDGRAALRLGRGLRAGLHVPDRHGTAGLAPFLLARRARPGGLLLTVAAHGRAGLARARRLGADAVILSPVFPTASHPGAPALGLLAWAALARRAGRPVVALGGVTGANAGRLPRWAAGFAAIGALAGAPRRLWQTSHSVSGMSR
ncbi:thiamine phosphate synthase [Siccirubricoccus sp. G192]|uniref:thiamine phosphate synthase n=1 Tax=Siccirubricoccus sp. G192 TaxID=2849651 RepID=UPI001C2C646C|nr:thiamine phosphate synthase [Siccirubricoccus sp. G192]MBV1796011.1 thiamine phosphate synthase [Siccirubricoccus sp. G192]